VSALAKQRSKAKGRNPKMVRLDFLAPYGQNKYRTLGASGLLCPKADRLQPVTAASGDLRAIVCFCLLLSASAMIEKVK
jgi:hypothetical protein